MNNLNTDFFDLENIFAHISTFCRIDEHCRLKMIHLNNITPNTSSGWTCLAGKEVTEHRTIINCIRSFLHYQCRKHFGENCKPISFTEYQQIKGYKEHYFHDYQYLPEYNNISNDDQLGFLLIATQDKNSTINFYKDLFVRIYRDDTSFRGISKERMIEMIMKNCVFELP